MSLVREGVVRTFAEIRTSRAEQTLGQQLLKACKVRMAAWVLYFSTLDLVHLSHKSQNSSPFQI
jgi:hypothetical protein